MNSTSKGTTMLKAIGSVTALALALCTPGVYAQTTKKAPSKPATTTPAPKTALSGPAGIGKGDTEFGVFGNYTTYDDLDLDQLIVGVTLGKFLSDSFEFRIAPAISYITGSGFESFALSPVFSGEFLFRNASRSAPVVPFIGGGVGISIGYSTIDSPLGSEDFFNFSISVGPTGGVKYFLSERASLELALTYLIGLGTTCGDVDCFDTETDTLQQALRFNFYY